MRIRAESLECDAPGVPSDSSNLAYRAAELALRAAGRSAGLRITLEKRVPSQAGLGGGSLNAAYTLIGVNRLLNLGLSLRGCPRLQPNWGRTSRSS